MNNYNSLIDSIWDLIDEIELKKKYLFVIHQRRLQKEDLIGIDVLDWESEDFTCEGGWFKIEEVQNYLLGFKD